MASLFDCLACLRALRDQGKPAQQKHLPTPVWLAAYQVYAVAAAATGQAAFGDLQNHLMICLRVADEFNLVTAQCYDSVARHEWQRMGQIGASKRQVREFYQRLQGSHW